MFLSSIELHLCTIYFKMITLDDLYYHSSAFLMVHLTIEVNILSLYKLNKLLIMSVASIAPDPSYLSVRQNHPGQEGQAEAGPGGQPAHRHRPTAGRHRAAAPRGLGRRRPRGRRQQPGRRVQVGRGRGSQGHDHDVARPLGQAEAVRQGAEARVSRGPEAQQGHLRVQAADGRLQGQQRDRLCRGARAQGGAGRPGGLPPPPRAHSLLHHVRHSHEARYSRHW